jgi:hypothetical protein|tara:strand:+ start:924 stop:1679 length:756 start_codon:yes stop_codon:yes gene_type:complete
MKDYYRTYHIKIDIEKVKTIIEEYRNSFFCPFSNEQSYLNIYKGKECHVQFFNMQHCDYSRKPNREGQKYIKYLQSVERKLKNEKTYNYLKDNYDKFTIETNEENFILPHEDPMIRDFIRELESLWSFDASNRNKGKICRARLVRLPRGGNMPYHRDETSSDNIRVICPIITNSKVKSGFRDKLGERFYEFPATGHFYNFDDTKVEHGVFNESDQDRYALIFTVIGVSNMKEWDRAYYKNKEYWKAWSSGI